MGRVLITGGCRVHRLAPLRAVLAEGDHVICMDNFLTGSPDNIAPLMKNPRFTFISRT